MDEPIYFISDVHLGESHGVPEQLKESRLIHFLEGLRGHARRLYIVGDLFDFWFEYRSVVPKNHYRVLYALANLVNEGCSVIYQAGNHDFWLGSFLAEQIGVEIVYDPLEITHQDCRLFIYHGDGVAPGDHTYRLLKRILRNPLNIRLYQLLHPDLGIALARLASYLSRHYIGRNSKPPIDDYRAFALAKLKQGFDGVILGHTHIPHYEKTPEGKVYLNLGDWIVHFSFGLLRAGQLTLERDPPPPNQPPPRSA